MGRTFKIPAMHASERSWSMTVLKFLKLPQEFKCCVLKTEKLSY